MLRGTREPVPAHGLRPFIVTSTLGVSMGEQPTSPQQSEEEPLWKRIDRLARERGVTTTQLSKAADVTWAAAARWRKPPGPKKTDGAVPEWEHLAAVARALSMTIEELTGVYGKHEPTGAGWQAFKETTVYKSLTPEERILVIATPGLAGSDPKLSTWMLAAETQLSRRP